LKSFYFYAIFRGIFLHVKLVCLLTVDHSCYSIAAVSVVLSDCRVFLAVLTFKTFHPRTDSWVTIVRKCYIQHFVKTSYLRALQPNFLAHK